MGWAGFLQSLVGTGRRSEGCPPRRAQWVGVSQHVPRHEGQPSPAAAEGAEAGIVGRPSARDDLGTLEPAGAWGTARGRRRNGAALRWGLTLRAPPERCALTPQACHRGGGSESPRCCPGQSPWLSSPGGSRPEVTRSSRAQRAGAGCCSGVWVLSWGCADTLPPGSPVSP